MISSKNNILSHSKNDLTLGLAVSILALIASITVVAIFAFLAKEASGAFVTNQLAKFFTDSSWNPTIGQMNIVPMIVASILLTLGTVLASVPVSLSLLTLVTFSQSRLVARGVQNLLELFAAIPSVILGFWGLVTIVPILAEYSPPGASLLAGIIVLSLMIIPTISISLLPTFRFKKAEFYQTSQSLGLSKWTFLKDVVLPSSKNNIFAAIVLGGSRAVGETMAVVMVTGNIVQIPDSIHAPIRALTANIALEVAYATGSHKQALYFTGFTLCFMALVATLIVQKLSRGYDD